MYEWLKVAHIFSVIAWMAGMLYLPRLFIYHCDAQAGSDKSETFKVMERRLLRGIMNPAMIGTWVFGLWLAVEGAWFSDGWFHTKMALVLLMSAGHGFYAKCRKDFERDANTRSATFYRIANEVPAVALVIILIMVVVKPF